MKFSKKRISALLESSKIALNVAMNDEEIKNALMTYNFDEARLNEGLELYNQASKLAANQKKEYGEQYSAREEFEKVFEDGNDIFLEHSRFSKLAYRNNDNKLAKLGIARPRPTTIAGWLDQAKTFYQNALSDDELISQLSRYAITKEKLEAGQQLIIKVEESKAKHNIEMGEAQQATKLRNDALEKLDFFITELFTVAEFSLKDKPQQVEKLGITVYSEGYKRRRKKENNEETEDLTESE
jgi:hypothetical protein